MAGGSDGKKREERERESSRSITAFAGDDEGDETMRRDRGVRRERSCSGNQSDSRDATPDLDLLD